MELSHRPLAVAEVGSVVAMAAGLDHTCAVDEEQTLHCWGANGARQLGNREHLPDSSKPLTVRELRGVRLVAAGDLHTCAVVSSGEVWCWGSESWGRLGTGTENHDFQDHPARAVGLTAIISLAAGANHNCVATELGSVSCWGGSSHGETGSLDRRDQYVPRVVSDLSDVTEVAVGEDHSCVLHRGGRISCWGKAGVLGRDVGESFVPVPVRRISNAVTLTSGPNHVCALLADGHVACWGDNQYGQLGVDEETVESSPIPVRVEGITDAVAVAAGGGHTCSVSADQSTRCWGSNASGQLGTPRIEYNTHTPQVIGGS